jgi:hypothetical protein
MNDSRIAEFIKELSGAAIRAEHNLNQAAKDSSEDTETFKQFSEEMIAIRGTAEQLGFPEIANIAGLGEEIAIKGAEATKRHQKRKCMACLWDTVTTVKFMVSHPTEATGEEEKILVQRLQIALKRMGGPRNKIADQEIEKLLKMKPQA